MDLNAIEALARRIREKRAGTGIREAAKEVDVSAATLSRVENKKIPDLETFGKICRWLGDDPAIYLGLPSVRAEAPRAQVHFKKDTAIDVDTASALTQMILLAQKAMREEDHAV